MKSTLRGLLTVLFWIPATAWISNQPVIVVGGGPVGLATALTLSQRHGCTVTVLERSPVPTTQFDPARAYQYNINERGYQWVDQFPEIRDRIRQLGSSPPPNSMGTIVYVPADPNEPIAPPKAVSVRADSNQTTGGPRRSTWIPRHVMSQILEDACAKDERIVVHHNRTVASLHTDDPYLTVTCTDHSTCQAACVIGADGMDSVLRTTLEREFSRFALRQYRSPSTGLRLKALPLPPAFTIPNRTATVSSQSETMYVFRSRNKGRNNQLSLGLLPMKDAEAVRPANINTRPDHDLWKLRTGPLVKEWFHDAFPRLPWDDWVSNTDWEAYAQANGTTFPYCQYSGGAAQALSSTTTVALVGDACHAFPPDIGQGINAGLQDVLALSRAKDWQSYDRDRVPEHKALIRLARFGAPYQYRQSWRRDRIGKFVWTANVILRTLLNKLSLGVIPPVPVILMQDASLTYRQVMRRADWTAGSLTAVCGMLLARIAWKLLRT